jgi:hypothetical protein
MLHRDAFSRNWAQQIEVALVGQGGGAAACWSAHSPQSMFYHRMSSNATPGWRGPHLRKLGSDEQNGGFPRLPAPLCPRGFSLAGTSMAGALTALRSRWA